VQQLFPRDVVAFGVLRAGSEHFYRVAAETIAGFDERLAGLEVIVTVAVDEVAVTERCARRSSRTTPQFPRMYP